MTFLGASNFLAMVTVSFNSCCLINHHKSKCLNRQWFVISHNNDGWPWFRYCTYQCCFIKLRFNWVGRSKMAWLIGLTVEVGWHLEHHGSLPCGILSSSVLNWLLHMMVLGQSSKRVKMEAAWLSLRVVQHHWFHLLLVKASYKNSLDPRGGGRTVISCWELWKRHCKGAWTQEVLIHSSILAK